MDTEPKRKIDWNKLGMWAIGAMYGLIVGVGSLIPAEMIKEANRLHPSQLAEGLIAAAIIAIPTVVGGTVFERIHRPAKSNSV